MRAGLGKLRNKRFRVRKGPLVVYFNENSKLTKAFRSIYFNYKFIINNYNNRCTRS